MIKTEPRAPEGHILWETALFNSGNQSRVEADLGKVIPTLARVAARLKSGPVAPTGANYSRECLLLRCGKPFHFSAQRLAIKVSTMGVVDSGTGLANERAAASADAVIV